MKLCGSNKTQYYDPWGGDTAGRDVREQLRAGVFDPGGSFAQAQGAAQQAAAGYQSAANDPNFGRASGYLGDVMGGRYLHSAPALDKYEAARRAQLDADIAAGRRTAEADLAGQQASQRSQYGRSGLTYGTGNQQAAEATQAALQARLADSALQAQSQLGAGEALARLQNYQQERQAQTQAAGLAPGVASARAQLLGQAPGALMQPSQMATQLAQQMYGGASGETIQKPGVIDYAGQLMGLAAMGGM
jgi:hypothetical protein